MYNARKARVVKFNRIMATARRLITSVASLQINLVITPGANRISRRLFHHTARIQKSNIYRLGFWKCFNNSSK